MDCRIFTATLREWTLDALMDDLRNDSVRFIFPERAYREVKTEFSSFDTLRKEVKESSDKVLGYSARHAIATADPWLCRELDELVKRVTVKEALRPQSGCDDASE